MKKSTRIVSLVLVLLMLVGMMPLALFATGSEAGLSGTSEAPDYGNPVPLPTTAQITAIGASQYVRSDLEALTDNTDKAFNLTATAAGTPVEPIGSYVSRRLHLVNTGEVAYYYMLEEGGNKSIKIQASDKSEGEHYIQSYAYVTGHDMIFTIDLKRDPVKKFQDGTIIQFCTSINGTKSVNLVSVTQDGELYVSSNANDVLGYLNSETYTTVAARVDLTANKYYVYINGVCTNDDGYVFLKDSDIKAYSTEINKDPSKIPTTYPNAKLVDGAYEYSPLDYYFMSVRSFQSTPSKNKADMPIYVDNVAIYTKSTTASEKLVYIGEADTEYPDGFVEANGRVYYYVNNSRVAVGTYNVDGLDYYFNTKGEVLAADRTSLVDVNAYLNASTESGGKDRFRGDIGVQTNGLYVIQSRGKNITTFTANKVSLADFLEAKHVEWNVYTDGIQKNTMLPMYVQFDQSYTDNNPFNVNRNINFSDEDIKVYTASGNTTTFGSPSAVNGWTTLTFGATGFVPSRLDLTLKNLADQEKTEADLLLNTIEFKQWSTWGIGGGSYREYIYAEDKTTEILNIDYSIYFTSINLVKYLEPATSIEDMEMTGWVNMANGDKYYFPHWDHKLVKNATVEIDGIGYTFDKDGKLVGKANGIHTVQFGDVHYYKDGVMQVGDAYSKYVDGDKVYAINASGDYLGSYAGYTFAKAYADIDRKYERDNYIVKVDFNDISLGKKENKGTHGAFGETSITNAGLYATRRGTYTEIVADADGDHALKWNAFSTKMHTYFEVKSDKTTLTSVALSFDIKLDENWIGKSTLVQELVREGEDNDHILLHVNEQGCVTFAASGKGVAKLSSAEYTNITLVVRTPGLNEETSKYVAYADVYVNGVKLIDNEMYYNDTKKHTYVGTFRNFQLNDIKQASSMYLDDIYLYELADGELPDNIADMSTVTLENGFVNVDNAVRYYENGVFVADKTFEAVDESGKTNKYTANSYGVVTKFSNNYNFDLVGMRNPANGYVEYENEKAAFVLHSKQLVNVDFFVPDEFKTVNVWKDYDKILLDVYLPEYKDTGKPVPSTVLFFSGENENWYELNKDGDTYTEKAEISKPSVSESYTEYSITYNDGVTRNTRVYTVTKNEVTSYYGRTYDYNSTKVRLDDALNVGWNTIEIPIKNNRALEFIGIRVSGWDMNEDRKWLQDVTPVDQTPNGDKSFTEIVGDDYAIGYANLRLVSTKDIEEGVQPGWNADRTSYVSLDTMKPLTGIQRVDGLYYDFADGTSATLLDGLYTYNWYDTSGGIYKKNNLACEYVDGKPVIVDTAGYTLSMNGKIEVNYYLNITVLPESDAYIEFTVNSETTRIALNTLTKEANGYYKATVAIPAAEMTDEITAMIKTADGKARLGLPLAKYSAVQYADTILNGVDAEGNPFSELAKSAVKAMLNYAAASQEYFKHNTGNLANAILDKADQTLDTDVSQIKGEYSQSASDGFSGATYYSSSLGLEGTTSLYYIFNLAEDAAREDYEITVNGGLTIDEEETKIVNGKLRVKVTGITAANLSTAYTVTLTKGEEALSVTYSAMKYAELVVNRSDDTNLINVMKALYEYNVAAVDYSNPTTSGIYDASYTLLY